MRLTLKRHRDSRGTAATRIDVEVARLPSGTLELNYHVSGIISDLRIPPQAVPNRTDELWRHTCFEAFIRAPQSAPYYELNFSPSTEWAAYRFSGYRDGMMIARDIGPPRIKVTSNGLKFELQASLELGQLTDLPSDVVWHLGVSAVVEETNGLMSYWALEHPPDKADFHHPDCFAHTLPARGAP
jgi:hypothetical protein